MDTFARGLVTAAKLIEDNFIDGIRDARYASYKEGIGASIMAGKEDLESLSTYALGNGQPKVESSHIELIQNKLNDYLF
jgi:xylose isomerase